MPGIYTAYYILVCISKCIYLYIDLYIEPLTDIDLHGRSNLSYLSNKSRVQTFTLTHMQSLLKGF